jgi:hypothetical protein
MSAKKFRFVSPGVQIKEIDKSILPALPGAIGPVVIGRSLKGPSMVPVTVNTYEEFVQKFGEPSPGVSNRDIWRNGNDTGPTYGAYAAKAWLESSSPLTFLRLGGVKSLDMQTGGEAGWQTDSLEPSQVLTTNGGAFGLFLMPEFVGTREFALAMSSSAGPEAVTLKIKQDVSELETLAINFVSTSSVTNPPDVDAEANSIELQFSGSDGTDGSRLDHITASLATLGFTVVSSSVLENTFANYSVTGSQYNLSLPFTGPSKGTLASIFYLDSGSIQLVGDTVASGAVGSDTSGSAVLVKCEAGLTFKARIKEADGTSHPPVVFSFDKNKDNFIRKAFNTNPTLTNDVVIEDPKSYWLGETFEDSLKDVGISLSQDVGTVYGFVAPLKISESLANFRKDSEPSKTGWVISQHLNSDTDSYSPELMPKLFRFVAGEGLGGDFEQNNYKISIFDIKPPLTSFQKFGTFSVGVRRLADTDTSPEFVEVFSNLTLDPSSPNYIAARIGDRRIEWKKDPDSGEERFVELGNYINNSKIIRVEMHPTVEKGGVDSSALPFGFFGPTRYKTFTLKGATGTITEDNVCVVTTSASIAEHSGSADGIQTQIDDFDGKIVFPMLPLVVSASDVDPNDPSLAYFGMKVDEPLNESLKDLLRIKPSKVDSHLAKDSEGTEYSFIFSLDDVSGSVADGPEWVSGSRKEGDSVTAKSGVEHLLENGYNKFTMPLVGGFDGLDIKEREPFRNTKLSANSDAKTNYAYNSLKRAVDSVKDPEVLDMNLLMMPGVTNKGITNHMIRVCEKRADAMAIIDLEGGYEPDTESKESEQSRIGSVSKTLTEVKERNFNTSYACAYYPWVQMQDDNTGNKLWIPPSIVAFGTMASSQESSEVWFAPAGFNRGGLSVGSSGLDILNVRDKLTAKNRDALYERSVNPIASFPNEGLVIFGQKTLQAIPSALDRINVRRLVIFLKKEISRIAAGLLFEPNVEQTWKRFSVPTTRLLEEVKTGFGISDYRVVLDNTTTTPEEIDRNMMYAKLFIKPVYAIEFIGIDFVITNTGASFDDL